MTQPFLGLNLGAINVSQKDQPSNSDAKSSSTSLSYRDAGVDIDAGSQLIDRIKPIAAATKRDGVVSGLGGFGALFEIPSHYKHPILVSGTDGVGTKLKLAIDLNLHSTIGIDLVAMCANDLIVQGAEALFFLDYFATGKLDLDTASDVIKGIGIGCEQAGCALTGGETAEMPGMYGEGDYDLAGFCVGVVERDDIIDGSKVESGDVLLGITSSGPHSNGYSLVRKIIEVSGASLTDDFNGSSLGETLLAPTRMYVKPLLALCKQIDVHAMAHITGGGLPENLPRVLPNGSDAKIDTSSWQRPAIFDWLQEHGNVEDFEMLRTFNCGIGMVVCVAAEDAEKAIAVLTEQGEHAIKIGEIIDSNTDTPHVIFD